MDSGQRSSRLAQSATLAGAGGLLDAFTYLGHNHVFASAMTGNVVLLAVNVAERSWLNALQHLFPILSFVLGTCAARAFYRPRIAAKIRKPELVALSLEMAILGSLGFLPSTVPDFYFTVIIAFAAAIQITAFRNVEGYSYNSTITTGNLRSLGESVFEWLFRREPQTAKTVRVFAVICGAFFLGALAGALLTSMLGNRTLWIAIMLLGFPWMSLARTDERS